MQTFQYKETGNSKEKYKLTKSYKYALSPKFDNLSNIQFSHGKISMDGILTLNKGYSWNGANYFPDYCWIMRATAVHDALCRLIRECKMADDRRLYADREFYCIVRRDKNKCAALMTYLAIRGHQKLPYAGGFLGGLFGGIGCIFRKEMDFECGGEV